MTPFSTQAALVVLLLTTQLALSAHVPHARHRRRGSNRAEKRFWSTYDASTWIADETTSQTSPENTFWETVYVTETVYDDEVSTGSASSTILTGSAEASQTGSASASQTVSSSTQTASDSDSSSSIDDAVDDAAIISASSSSSDYAVSSVTSISSLPTSTLGSSSSSSSTSISSSIASVTATGTSTADSATSAESTTSASGTITAAATTATGTGVDIAELIAISSTTSLATDIIMSEIEALGITLSADFDLSIGFDSASTSTSSAAAATTTVSGDKKVFAHFMVGIVSTYGSSDWVSDMQLAKSKGIDGFALNIGTDSYTETQLDLAFAAGESTSFDLFISFDFNWYTTTNVSGVADMLARYKDSSAHYRVDDKPFVSTFIGGGFDWSSVATEVGESLYVVPYWDPTSDNANNDGLSGLFSWSAWPGQIDNVPVDETLSTDRDELYLGYTEAAGKTYMAPVSTWFSTHFGTEVSYSKNFLFKSETLWKYRWDQILAMGSRLNFVEIVTWNDYGESHNVGPYDTPHTDDTSSLWASGLDHSAMLDFAVPYITAFKNGYTTPVIEDEQLVYWYRPHLKDVSCDTTDNCGSKPTGWDYLEDTVFVSTQTKWGGILKVTSGDNSAVITTVDKGVQVVEVPMAVGTQTFELITLHGGFVKGTSNVSVIDTCWNGIYNYNFHSGLLAC